MARDFYDIIIVSLFNKKISYFIQINIGDESQKSGIYAKDAKDFLKVDTTADDTMSFFLNDNITSLVSVQSTKIHPTSGTWVQFSNADDSALYFSGGLFRKTRVF